MDPMTRIKTSGHYQKHCQTTKKFLVFLLHFKTKKYVADFRKKTELLNLFFAEQWSKIDNSSKIPLKFSQKNQTNLSL